MAHDPIPDDDELVAPADLGPSGLAFWTTLTDTFDFDPHDLALVEEASRVKDRLDELDAVIRAEGVTITTAKGDTKAHPALVEARGQGIVLTRLVASLRLPDDAGARTQHRGGGRGAYSARRTYGTAHLRSAT